MVRFPTVAIVLTTVAACGSGPSGPKNAPVEPPTPPTPPIVEVAPPPIDAAVVEEVHPPALACEAGTTIVAAPAPAPTWWCARPDGTRHGPFVTTFPDATIEISGRFVDDLLDGAWQRHHPGGAVAEVGVYAAGKKHGRWKQLAPDGRVLGEYEMQAGTGIERRWLADGRLYSEVAFADGREHGAAKYFASDGALIRSAHYAKGELDGAYVSGAYYTMRFDERYAGGVRRDRRRIWRDGAMIADEHYDRRGKLDGAYTLWRNRKIARVTGRYAHGQRTGAWVWHDRDGRLEREGSYLAGKRDGTWTEWWNGKVVFTGHYSAGRPDGDFAYFDRNGNELGRFTIAGGTGTMVTFHGNKQPATKQRLVNGVEDGLYQELTPRGKVTVEGSYRKGLKHGRWREWTADRVLVLDQTWRRGKLHGAVKKYVDGVLSLEATYQDGQAHGPYAEHRNGKPAVTGSYAADHKDGTWTHYAIDGSVVLVATYKAGVLDGPWRQLENGEVAEGTMAAGRRAGRWTWTNKAGHVREVAYVTP